MIESFRDLIVYQKAYELSKDIHHLSLCFPKHEQYSLADQMRRASRSICANIAEGFGKQRNSKAEFRRFLSMATGSAHEMLVWIDYCPDFQYINNDVHQEWSETMIQTIKMLHGLQTKA